VEVRRLVSAHSGLRFVLLWFAVILISMGVYSFIVG
jgi:hypothetical protein